MSPLGAVVVGSAFGARVHVPALRAAGFEVEALVGRDSVRTERRAARLGIPRALTSIDEALAIPSVCAVTVATPPAAHAPVVHAALAAGKHAICEKPFAIDVAEARAMRDAAEAAGVVHRMGFEFRWAPERATVGRAIAHGAIGTPRFASLVSYVGLVADTGTSFPAWWWDVAQGGGWLRASGSHMIDQIRVWLGEIEWVSADLTSLAERGAVAEDSFSLLFRTLSGATGVLQQTGGAWGKQAGMTRIAGTAGSLWTEGPTIRHADAEGVRELPIPADLQPPEVAEVEGDSRHRYTHLELGPYTRLCESFRDAILAPKGAPTELPAGSVQPATFEDGLASVKVIEAARLSMAQKQWMNVSSGSSS